MFCPRTYVSEYQMEHVTIGLLYVKFVFSIKISTGEFQTMGLIVLAAFDAVD